MKNIIIFSLKIFIFLVVNFSVYLNRHVFVMPIHSFVSSTGTLDRKGLTMKAPQHIQQTSSLILFYFSEKIRLGSLCDKGKQFT